VYVDAHCHIDRYPQPSAVLAAAERARVVTVAVTETPSTFQALLVKTRQRRMVRVALGLHPLRAGSLSALELSLFSRMLDSTDYVGEVGLDFSPAGTMTRERQIEAFEHVLAQPGIQAKLLTVHSRRAEADVITRLRDASVTAVLHWYSGPLKQLRAGLDAGFWFSVNPAMLASKNGRRIIAELPRDRVLTETDGPYTRHLGRPAAPHDLPDLITQLASFWRVDREETRALVFANMTHAYRAATSGRDAFEITGEDVSQP